MFNKETLEVMLIVFLYSIVFINITHPKWA
jgi:hypothetical protein